MKIKSLQILLGGVTLMLLASLFACDKDKKEEPQGAKIESISFKQESYSVEEHQTDGLNLRGELKIAPAVMADTCKVTWALSNTEVASISKDGVITPKKVGETTVTATVQGKSAQCKYTVTKHVVPVESVKVIPASFADDVNVGATKKLEIEVEPSDATYETVAWKSSNTAVATVSADGTVTCKGEGTCTITATIDGKVGTCKVTYSNNIIHVTSVTVTPSTFTDDANVGSTKKLTATVKPDNATDKTVSWKSSNTAVATVSQDGTVTCKGVGEATITATCGGQSGTCKVTFIKIPVTSVTVTPDTWDSEGRDGKIQWFVAKILPENATEQTVTWTTSNPEVAVVDQGGHATYKGIGTCTITATVDGKKGTSTVTFTKVSVQSVTVSPSTYTADYSLGATKQLTASVYPWTATYQTVTWKSSNTSVATVDNNGLVTCKGAGSATITATADGKSGTCEVTFEPDVIRVESVKLSRESANIMGLGTSSENEIDCIRLIATVNPPNATHKNVTWTSDDPSVATVTQDGLVIGQKGGRVFITAEADGKSRKCLVEVHEAAYLQDCEGHKYKTVKIGSQWWMAEDLRCGKYDSQSERKNVTLPDKYSGSMDDYDPYYWDASKESNWKETIYTGILKIYPEEQAKLGYVYTWAAAVGLSSGAVAKAQTTNFSGRRQGICPNGWHVPTMTEWQTLINSTNGGDKAGDMLKKRFGWYNYGVGTNLTLFGALPSGQGNSTGVRQVGSTVLYWLTDVGTSSNSESNAYYSTMSWNSDRADLTGEMFKRTACAVRCVKN